LADMHKYAYMLLPRGYGGLPPPGGVAAYPTRVGIWPRGRWVSL